MRGGATRAARERESGPRPRPRALRRSKMRPTIAFPLSPPRYDFEEPLLYLCIFLMLGINGPGPLSVDANIARSLGEDDA